MGPTIDELVLAVEPAAWAAAGFTVTDGTSTVGSVRLRLAGPGDAGRGIVSWSLRDATATELDGLPTEASSRPPASPAAHPNGAERIDHVVVVTPDLERTTAALAAAGVERRRVRDVPLDGRTLHQGFFRLGEVILEVVDAMPLDPSAEPAPGDPAAFWGLVFAVADLDSAAARVGDHLGTPRDAVQPGQRIATFRRGAGLGLPVALIS